MDQQLIVAILVVSLALFFNFSNGFNDSATQVATVIASGALTPEIALTLAALSDFAGSYFLGTSVAKTIGKGIVDPELMQSSQVGIFVVYSALLGALTWNLLSWRFSFPCSSSHSLIGGLLGSFVAGWGIKPVHWALVAEIIIVMLVSPIVVFILTYFFTKLTFFFSSYSSPKVNGFFKKMQVFSLIGQSLSHGANDGQKTMGVIVFGLLALNYHNPVLDGGFIPKWVALACSLAISFGVFFGGWRMARKIGSGFFRVRPIHAFASQSASGAIMYAASVLGFPISTTQVMTSSILGSGAAFRPKAVRWELAADMVTAWLITIPLSAAASAIYFYAGKIIFGQRIG